jgi:hypothetical protein
MPRGDANTIFKSKINKVMAKLYKTSGEVVQDVDISSLKKMQELVGGYIEIVVGNEDRILIVNEEGLLNGLPHNENASLVYGYPLVGNVIQCTIEELNERS